MASRPSPVDLLTSIAEPTRLRIINCLAAAPLFVSDLQVILKLPQPTVSRHLRILRDAGVVRDTPIAQFVLYRLRPGTDADGRLVAAIMESLAGDETFNTERQRAADRSHTHTRQRTAEPVTE